MLRLGGPAALTVAGRTDAGVHARGQVAHTDIPTSVAATFALPTPSQRPPLPQSEHAKHGAADMLARRLNGVLPQEVRIFSLALAPPGFDARFAALSRRYAYRVSDHPAAVDPLRRHEVLWHKRPLDTGAMNDAAAPLIGVHDFAAYCRRRAGATTVRRLLKLDWTRAEGGLAVCMMEADAFCHNMVRALVGAMIAVGDGHRPVDWPATVLASGVRDPAVSLVPPHGLTLEEIRYPDTPEAMAARSVESRRRRSESQPTQRT